jgi:hypothetical protein
VGYRRRALPQENRQVTRPAYIVAAMKLHHMFRILLATVLATGPIAATTQGAQASSKSALMNITVMVVRSSSATIGTRNARFFALVVPGDADAAPVQYAIRDSHGERPLAGGGAVDRAVLLARRGGEHEITLTTLF